MIATPSYRPEIDGLRTVAVMLVVLYHVGFPVFPGGYVGVDVFFVISGFLITSLIKREVEANGNLNFERFYVRRILRLFPAFAMTAVVSTIFAYLLFSTENLTRFGGSLLAATFSLSNFFFWAESGYFDVDATTKPLLHTWSLSVEEQFYILWPAALTLLLKSRGRRILVPTSLGLLCATSLVFSEVLLPIDPSGAYYLLPSRAVELAIGASIAWFISGRPLGPPLASFATGTGLALIVWSSLTYSTETRFPGVNALAPCLGAALVIVAGPSRVFGQALSSVLMVQLGRASYSIYLLHWPIIVFFHEYTYRTPTFAEGCIIVFASIALGFLQWAFIEERFRHGIGASSGARVAMAVAIAVLIIPSFLALQTGGAGWRIPNERTARTNSEWRNLERQKYCVNWSPNLSRDLFTCQNHRSNSAPNIIAWGDSHALHLAAGLSETFPSYNVYIIHMDGCVPQSGFGGYVHDYKDKRTQECLSRNKRALDALARLPPSAVIITSAQRGESDEMIGPLKELLAAASAPGRHSVVYLADFIRPAIELIACGSVPDAIVSDELLSQRCTGNAMTAAKAIAYNDVLASELSPFINVNNIQCPKGRCIYYKDGIPLFRDGHHLTTFGSAYFVGLLQGRLKDSISEAHLPSTAAAEGASM